MTKDKHVSPLCLVFVNGLEDSKPIFMSCLCPALSHKCVASPYNGDD